MFSVLGNIYEFLYNAYHYKADSTSELPLLNTPLPAVIISILYIFFVLKWGPAYMKDRAPFNIKYILLAYNFTQIILNVALNLFGMYHWIYYNLYDLGCLQSLPNEHPLKHYEVLVSYCYFLMKLVDYLETIFFVLRKSFKQISFLHVYHHMLLVIIGYFYLRYNGSGGPAVMFFLLNTIVHGFMYTYYFVSALSENMKNSIWWKKYITRLQLFQFTLLFIHIVYTLVFRPTCKIGKPWLYLGLIVLVSLFILFGNFYRKAYMQRDSRASHREMAKQKSK